MFLAARAVLLSMRAREDFGCAGKLSAAEQIKPDCCRAPAVVSIFTDSAACVLSFYHSTPLHVYVDLYANGYIPSYASDSGENLHCFLVGANKSCVIATSDLWLFIHASNLLPSLPTPLPYNSIRNKTINKIYENERNINTLLFEDDQLHLKTNKILLLLLL